MLRDLILNYIKSKLPSLLTSRRFQLMATGIAVTLMREKLGLDEQSAIAIAALIGVWIWGDSQRATV